MKNIESWVYNILASDTILLEYTGGTAINPRIYYHFPPVETKSYLKSTATGTDTVSYFSASNYLLPSQNKIYRHDGFSADIIDSFSSPNIIPRCIYHDSTYLYSTDIETDRIYKHSGFSSRILDSFSSYAENPTGVTVLNDYVYVLCASNDRIYKHSGFNVRILDSFSLPSNGAWGLFSSSTNLYTTDTITNKIYKHCAITPETIVSSFNSPGTSPSAGAIYLNNVYTTDLITNKIYKHNGFSSNITTSFTVMYPNLVGFSISTLTYETAGAIITYSSMDSGSLYGSNIVWALQKPDEIYNIDIYSRHKGTLENCFERIDLILNEKLNTDIDGYKVRRIYRSSRLDLFESDNIFHRHLEYTFNRIWKTT